MKWLPIRVEPRSVERSKVVERRGDNFAIQKSRIKKFG